MIPYLEVATFKLGPLTIHTWGFVVSIGIAVALAVTYRRAKSTGLEANKVLDLAFWILVAAFIGARLFHVFFYEWHYYSMHLKEIVRIDQGGLSSFGGFIGALAAFWWYGKRKFPSPQSSPTRGEEVKRVPSPLMGEGRGEGGHLLWRYADLLMFAWPLGHGIGRIGCFLTHMHPGRLSTVPWAVAYPGGTRLDMGIIESVVLLSYWVALVIFDKRRLPSPGLRPPSPLGRGEGEGRYLVSGMIFYGATRFVLDFFRATDLPMSDTRYLGLTPAQYGSIVLLAAGIYLYARRRTFRPVS